MEPYGSSIFSKIVVRQDLRRRYRYLSHLPIGRPFYFVELDLQPPTVSQKTLDEMSDLLLARSRKREQQLQKEMLLTLAKEEAENRIPTLPLGCRLVAHADLTEVPTDEDFVPLCEMSDVQSGTSRFNRSFASVSKVGASAVVDSHRIANFPERGDGETNRRVGYICAAELWPSLTEASPITTTNSGAWALISFSAPDAGMLHATCCGFGGYVDFSHYNIRLFYILLPSLQLRDLENYRSRRHIPPLLQNSSITLNRVWT
ncbi:unnamed protein product [Dibothriocephalus latus]|uniref:Uncharacterized protein n=1 Tax=Dibothriocephalus latus TaxID=60516 RepID=A0A3P7P1G4_DIBLA|nr:unnamed protein product [Dibothriocephalus latus]